MGNSESEQMNVPPLIKKIRQCLNLSEEEGKPYTKSMIHSQFSNEFDKNEGSKLNRNMSPFCPLDIEDGSNWITACFVSPAMLIASPLYLCDKDGYMNKDLVAIPVNKKSMVKIPISQFLMVERLNVCLLLLEEPFWKVGWAGITYIKSIEDLRKEKLKIVNHPERKTSKQDEDIMIHVQMSRNFILPDQPTPTNPYAVEVNGITGSLICKLVDKKPYIVGVQASEHEAIFFSEQIYKKMGEVAKKCLRKDNLEREIIKKMDIVEFEQETHW